MLEAEKSRKEKKYQNFNHSLITINPFSRKYPKISIHLYYSTTFIRSFMECSTFDILHTILPKKKTLKHLHPNKCPSSLKREHVESRLRSIRRRFARVLIRANSSEHAGRGLKC